MTIRDLREVMTNVEVCIKPLGRRKYYAGMARDIPDRLLDCEVREIDPKAYDNTDTFSHRRVLTMIGIWVDAFEEWDLLVDAYPDLIDSEDEQPDVMYQALMVDPERLKSELREIIRSNSMGEVAKREWHKARMNIDPSYSAARKELTDIIQVGLDEALPEKPIRAIW